MHSFKIKFNTKNIIYFSKRSALSKGLSNSKYIYPRQAGTANSIDKIYLPADNQNETLEYENIYKDRITIIFVDNYLEIYQLN